MALFFLKGRKGKEKKPKARPYRKVAQEMKAAGEAFDSAFAGIGPLYKKSLLLKKYALTLGPALEAKGAHPDVEATERRQRSALFKILDSFEAEVFPELGEVRESKAPHEKTSAEVEAETKLLADKIEPELERVLNDAPIMVSRLNQAYTELDSKVKEAMRDASLGSEYKERLTQWHSGNTNKLVRMRNWAKSLEAARRLILRKKGRQ